MSCLFSPPSVTVPAARDHAPDRQGAGRCHAYFPAGESESHRSFEAAENAKKKSKQVISLMGAVRGPLQEGMCEAVFRAPEHRENKMGELRQFRPATEQCGRGILQERESGGLKGGHSRCTQVQGKHWFSAEE